MSLLPCDWVLTDGGHAAIRRLVEVSHAELNAVLVRTRHQASVLAAINEFRPILEELAQNITAVILYTHGTLTVTEHERE
jgi:hypothetical protein